MRKTALLLISILVLLVLFFWNSLSSFFSGDSTLYVKFDEKIKQNPLDETSFSLRTSDNEYISFDVKDKKLKVHDYPESYLEKAITTDSLIELFKPKNLGFLKLDEHDVYLVKETMDNKVIRIIPVKVGLVLED